MILSCVCNVAFIVGVMKAVVLSANSL